MLKTSIALIIALLSLPSISIGSASGAIKRQVQTHLSPSEHISGSWVSDQGEFFLAIASTEGRSRVVHSNQRGEVEEYSLPNFRANRLSVFEMESSQPATGQTGHDRAFICGSVAENGSGHYSCRVYLFRDDTAVVIWDSKNLQFARESGESAAIQASDDGRFWGVMAAISDEKMAVRIGAFPGYSEDMKIDLMSSLPEGDLPLSVALDRYDFVFVESGPHGPLVALVWQGTVYVVGNGKPALKAIARTKMLDGHRVYWQPQGRRLWVRKPSGYESYKLPANTAQTDQTLRLSIDSRVNPVSGFVERFKPLSDGTVAVVGGPRQARQLRISTEDNKRWAHRIGFPIQGQEVIEISSSGKTALVFGDGAASQTVKVIEMRGSARE